MAQNRARTRPQEVEVETSEGETWHFRLDFRAYEEIADRTGVDLTTEEGQEAVASGEANAVRLKTELMSAGFRSGFLHERKRELMEEEGLTSVRALAKARPILEELPPEAVKAAITPELIAAVEEQVDDLREEMASQAEAQEEIVEGEGAGDPLGTGPAAPAAGDPEASSDASPPHGSSSG